MLIDALILFLRLTYPVVSLQLLFQNHHFMEMGGDNPQQKNDKCLGKWPKAKF
jgi:hypothetical protein